MAFTGVKPTRTVRQYGVHVRSRAVVPWDNTAQSALRNHGAPFRRAVLCDGTGSTVGIMCEYSTSAVPHITMDSHGLPSARTLKSTVVQV